MQTLFTKELSKKSSEESLKDSSIMPSRRSLLKMATGISISLPILNVMATEDPATLSYHRLKNQMTAEGINQGTVVLVDKAINEFDGNGFYLYPDWGQPLVYEVRKKGNRLTFHYPGVNKVLWQLSANHQNARFSGRVEGVLDLAQQSRASLQSMPALDVPELPIT